MKSHKKVLTKAGTDGKIILASEANTSVSKKKKINFKTKKVYSAPAVVDAKAKYRAHLAKYCPEHPMTGPLSMLVIWFFPADDNHPIGYCTNKPDLDNANKLLQEVMQELGFFEDDKQIVNLHLSKRYTNSPGVVIYLDNAEV